ncbi:SCO family protein [Defluviimonas sp. SAOS-178_SWC]|uniref:SCO family protein n=1 Tax=Defluviimonas sp. SAOS-178_SWC TaxID=3121287 RepID=UPI003221F0B9
MAPLRALAIVLLGIVTPSAVLAASGKLDAEVAYEESQAAIGNQTADHVFTDHRGRTLALADLRGKPVVVALVFTSCATVCPLTTDHLRDAIVAAQKAVGGDAFTTLTFGFDASGDRPAQLAGFAGTHRLLEVPNWLIASADPATTEAFLSELGFSFRTAAGGFDHVTQTTILDAGGRVYRQVYGDTFPLPVLMEPLKELALGTVTRSVAPADLWDRVAFLCTVYNPLTGAYRFDYGIFFGIFFGAVSLILTGFVIVRLWLERRRALKTSQSGTA